MSARLDAVMAFTPYEFMRAAVGAPAGAAYENLVRAEFELAYRRYLKGLK